MGGKNLEHVHRIFWCYYRFIEWNDVIKFQNMNVNINRFGMETPFSNHACFKLYRIYEVYRLVRCCLNNSNSRLDESTVVIYTFHVHVVYFFVNDYIKITV